MLRLERDGIHPKPEGNSASIFFIFQALTKVPGVTVDQILEVVHLDFSVTFLEDDYFGI